jgi:hypothetical protein
VAEMTIGLMALASVCGRGGCRLPLDQLNGWSAGPQRFC